MPVDKAGRAAHVLALAGSALLLAGWALTGGLPRTNALADLQPGPLVAIGVPDLFWEDLGSTATPHLWELAKRSAVSQISVRSIYRTPCPIDGWLTVSAGQRAALSPELKEDITSGCPPVANYVSADGTATAWSTVGDWNRDTGYSAVVGGLGTALHNGGQSVLAVGPGAALALTSESGAGSPYVANADSLTVGAFDAVDMAMVDLQPTTPAELDAGIEHVLRVVPDNATILLFGIGSSDAHAGLQAALMSPPEGQTGLLTSNSTRQDGLILLTDVTSTVLKELNLTTTDDMVGQPIETIPSDKPLWEMQTDFNDLDVKADTYSALLRFFFLVVVSIQLMLYAVSTYVFRRRTRIGEATAVQSRVFDAVGAGALYCSLVPFACLGMNLWRWWQFPHPLVFAVLTILLLVAVPGRIIRFVATDAVTQVGLAASLTSVLVAADLVFGGTLERLSVLGYSPIIGGRFYGLGNLAFAVFTSASIYAFMWLAEVARKRGWPTVPAVTVGGLVCVAVVAAPSLGADLGGALSLISGLGVMILGLAGMKITCQRIAAVLAIALGAVAAISFIDWLRPADQRTHLGSFLQSVIDGDAGTIVARKAEANVHVLTSNWVSLLVPIAFIFLGLVLYRNTDRDPSPLRQANMEVPSLRPAFLGWLVTMIVGSLVNDSGVVIAAVGLMVVVPFLIVIACKQASREVHVEAITPTT